MSRLLNACLLSVLIVLAPSYIKALEGDLDPAFGTGGKVFTSINSGWDWASTVKVQPDGKILVAGMTDTAATTKRDAFILRYLTDGSLDPSFGSAGVVTANFTSGDDYSTGVEVLAGGKILLIGHNYTGSAIVFIRYNDNGTVDSTFGTSGKATHSISSQASPQRAAIQKDGKILIVGSQGSFPDKDILVLRYNADGSVDSTFGTGGKVLTSLGANSDSAYAVTVQPDGKILVGGTARTNGVTFWDMMLLRYNSNGTLDSTFNGTGKVLTNFNNLNDGIYALALQSDGKIVAAGYGSDTGGSWQLALTRYLANGSLDTSFNGTGKVLISTLSTYGGQAQGIAITADGNIVVGGQFTRVIGDQDFFTARFTPDGLLDANFGTGGVTKSNRAGDERCESVAMQENGNVLLTGFAVVGSSRDVIVHRYLNSNPKISVFTGASTDLADERAANTPYVFANTSAGSSSAEQTFTIQNSGDADITGFSVALASTGQPGAFALNTSGLVTTLVPGDSTTFSVAFSPLAEGASNATVLVSLASGKALFSLPLKGFTQKISFAQASSSRLEDAVKITLPVQLTAAAGEAFTVPVSYAGSATNGTDYTRDVTTLKFSATQTSSSLSITIKDELLPEGDETVVLTLGQPSVPGIIVGAIPSHTLTIQEDDVLPTIAPALSHQLVAVGDPVQWTTNVGGSAPLTISWKKGSQVIPAATTGQYSIISASLTDGTSYTLTAKNQRGTVTSVAQLGVVQRSNPIVRANVNASALLSVAAAGNSLTYQWHDPTGTVLVNSSKYAGVTSSKLTIKALQPGDSGLYTCTVTGPGGSLGSGDHELQVPSEKPVAVTPSFPDVVAYNRFEYQLTFDTAASKAPTKFVCTGLPAGVTCNAITGFISGTPKTPGDYTVSVVLSNSSGPADVIVQDTIKVLSYPSGAVGSYTGLIERHEGTNASLGGRVDLSTSVNGSFSGTLRLGAQTFRLESAMQTSPAPGAHPMVTLTFARSGKSSVIAHLDLDPASDTLTGSVTEQSGLTSAAIAGWRNVWRTTAPANPVVTQLGSHSFELEPAVPDVAGQPQGYGYGTLSVAASGATTIKGVTADGGPVLCSAIMGPAGEVLLYQLLFSNKSSIMGNFAIASDATHTLTGTANWQRTTASSSVRDYKPFGPMLVQAFGGLHTTAAPVLGLSVTSPGTYNAQLLFSKGGISASSINPNLSFRISSTNSVELPSVSLPSNPGKISKLSLNASTGAFSGKFTLTDAPYASRVVSFQGQLVPARGKGFGYFLLPQLPDGTAVPPTTTTTSPILSGRVVLEAFP